MTKTAYLEAGATHGAHQRKGVATALIREAERLAKEHGGTHIGLEVGSTDNPDAKRLYEHLGYVEWGQGDDIQLCADFVQTGDHTSGQLERAREANVLPLRHHRTHLHESLDNGVERHPIHRFLPGQSTFSIEQEVPKFRSAHRKFVHDYNVQVHFAHRERQDNRHSPQEVLRGVLAQTIPSGEQRGPGASNLFFVNIQRRMRSEASPGLTDCYQTLL